MSKLSWREDAALKAFEGQEVVRFCDLPTYVGRTTMARLTEKGLVEPANTAVVPYSVHYGWKLVRPV